jgi:isoquinoline 1-oxidoreductase subunit beta
MNSRRDFIAAAGLAFVLPFHLPTRAAQAKMPSGAIAYEPFDIDHFPPNAFIRVEPDGRVTLNISQGEMGQGVHTSCAQLIAEEFDCGWKQVRVAIADHDPVYLNPEFGVQATGGSSSMPAMWGHLRNIGAKARAMFVSAGAARMGVPVVECTASEGRVRHKPSARSVGYGEIAAQAMKLPEPQNVTLKAREQFTIIGKSVARVDTAAKLTGKAQYGIDIQQPGMLVALLTRSPVPGGKVKRFDAVAAKAVPGVRHVAATPVGIAVIASGYWPAHKARALLKIEWDDGAAASSSSELLLRQARALTSNETGLSMRKDGQVDPLSAPAQIDVHYDVPYLTHVPIEPLNCTARVDKTACEIWVGTELPSVDCMAVANLLGFKKLEQVKMHCCYMGGAFGRRASPDADFVLEAVHVARIMPGVPIKLMWSREDDLHHGKYRPLFANRLRANLGTDGMPTSWHHITVGSSITKGTSIEPYMVNNEGVDERAVIGALRLPYSVPNLQLNLHEIDSPTPVLWWRSVGHSVHGFATESFIDELAHAAKADPVAYRLALLRKEPTHRAVLERVAVISKWNSARPTGSALGVSVHESYRSVSAMVAEVSLQAGQLKVEHIWSVVNCGQVVNPDIVRQQAEGGIGFGLSATLFEEITVDKGRVQQSNFHDYRILRFNEMPPITVEIMDSQDTPRGVGEATTPLVAAAVANAAFKLTGKRARTLPLSKMTWL